MKFDATRALVIVEELRDSRFAGAAGEARVADFVEEQFEKLGFTVERREVEGSRFPQRFAPWLGWLGYGALITTSYVMLLRMNPLFWFMQMFLLLLAHGWLNALLVNLIRWGRRMPPIEKTPLLIARPPGDSSPAVRVVFQAVLGGLKTDFFALLGLNRAWLMMTLHGSFFVTTLFAVAARLGNRPIAPVILVSLASGFFALIWFAILSMLYGETLQSRSVDGSHHADGRGLALLLEMARSSPRNRSRPIELVFVAAGGQRLDYAGSREVVRLLKSEWPAKPSLLLLFFAPGAGAEHRLVPILSFSGWGTEHRRRRIYSRSLPRMDELVRDVARSLWIPIKGNDPWSHFLLWPFERKIRASDEVEIVVLSGSSSQLHSDASVDPKVLEHAAQLATEIALRWARKQQESADS